MSLADWWRRLFRPPAPPPRRPRPPDWTLTIAELMASGRPRISGEEIEWARSYERDQLRAWARFPRDGEVFEAGRELDVDFITHWAAPFTGGGTGRLAAGERVRVQVGAQEAEPIGVYATPLDDGRFERAWVPEAERTAPRYTGFSLYIPVQKLNEEFVRVG